MIRLGRCTTGPCWNLLQAVHAAVASRVRVREDDQRVAAAKLEDRRLERPPGATAATDVPTPVEPVSVTTATRSFRFRKVRVSAEGELHLVGSSELERVLRLELLAACDVLLDLSLDRLHRLERASCDRQVGADCQGHRADLEPEPRPAGACALLMEIVGVLPFIPFARDGQVHG